METTRKIWLTEESYVKGCSVVLEDRRQQSSVIRTSYNILRKFPAEERPTATDSMKDDSIVRQKTDKMNHTERVNYILRNSAFMLASSMAAGDDVRRKEDDKKEEKVLKKIEKK